MIAPWMLYVLLVTALLGTVAVMAERVAVVQGWTRRWIWVGAIGVTLALVAWSTRRSEPVAPPSVRDLAIDAAPTALGPARRELGSRERAPIVRWGALSEVLDRPLRVLWIAASAGVLVLLGYAAAVLWRRRRAWRATTVDGVPVLVAAGDGPAVVGFFRQRVVVPDWSLGLDEPARRMMLRHEMEHVRARDPLLTQLLGATAVILPWNLPLWWMLRRLRLAVEVDCDARVLAHTPRPAMPAAQGAREYGELLLTVATRQSRQFIAAPALLEHTTALGRRIMAMNPRFPRFPRAHNTVFAAGAAVLALWAAGRQPPPVDLAAPAAAAHWVASWRIPPVPPLTVGQLRERLAEREPGVSSAAGPTVVMLARQQNGVVRTSLRGSAVHGPLLERVAAGYGHAIELLVGAATPAQFAAADSAFFGGAARASVEYADAPVRDGVNATAVGVMRLAPGVVGPGTLYVFVVTLRNDWPAR